MDGFDVLTGESSPTKTKAEETTNDESAWFTENDHKSLHSDDSCASNLPEKDQSSFNIFSNDDSSPLDAMTKKRQEEIAAKDAEETRKIAILRTQARTDLDNWYSERQRQLEQKLQTMKTADNDLQSKALEKARNTPVIGRK